MSFSFTMLCIINSAFTSTEIFSNLVLLGTSRLVQTITICSVRIAERMRFANGKYTLYYYRSIVDQ